jgi:hypothetical protein
MIKPRRIRFAGHIVYGVLVETPEGKLSLGRHKASMGEPIYMDTKETGECGLYSSGSGL